MKKLQGFVAIAIVAGVILSPLSLVHADAVSDSPAVPADTQASVTDQTVITSDASSATIAPTGTDESDMDPADEITFLQTKVDDPTVGFFTKLILRLKIHQLENQISIQNSVQNALQ